MAKLIETTEEKEELAPGVFHILKVEKFDNGSIRKTSSGFNEVNGKRVSKISKVQVAITKLSDIDQTKPLSSEAINLINQKKAIEDLKELILKGID